MTKKYRVTASYIVYCYATIEAESQDEAENLANNMDGGDFEVDEHGGLGDWNIDGVTEVTQ